MSPLPEVKRLKFSASEALYQLNESPELLELFWSKSSTGLAILSKSSKKHLSMSSSSSSSFESIHTVRNRDEKHCERQNFILQIDFIISTYKLVYDNFSCFIVAYMNSSISDIRLTKSLSSK
ncbi:hypothetical protein T01_2701 [Trichinella spiralis]|uniref:Uncharacterized protein n=1 Tax=Trichinella spiralis TaxID=6334 RepID=A0A0V1B5P3_TRISP|nr:hypothetical protein T01_2701 [Trichinella spiralis]